MDSYLHPSSEDIRISTSPRRSPQITEAVSSPARSHYPTIQQMDSMHTQPDFGLRNTDFFDDSSDGGSAQNLNALTNAHLAHEALEAVTDGIDDLLPRKGSKASRRASGVLPGEPVPIQHDSRDRLASIRGPAEEGYTPLMATAVPEEDEAEAQVAERNDLSSSSLVGSVDELLPDGHASSPLQFPKEPRKASIRPTSRWSGTVGDRTSKLSQGLSQGLSQTLGAYAIAHEITLQALMRDESALDGSFTQFQTGNRHSMLPFSAPPIPEKSDLRNSRRPRPVSSSTVEKKVHVVPPPIDTTATRKSIPDDIVRTPYPFSPETAHQKLESKGDRISAYAIKPISTTESILTLLISQSNPNSKPRSTNLTIPASSDFSVIRSHSPRSKEQHFRALDFDDEALFRALRARYAELMGPWRYLSARSLRRICVAGEAMRKVDRGYWILQPLRTVPGVKTNNTHTQERMTAYLRNPGQGKLRYAFVQWAHRIASASTRTVRTPRPGDELAAEAREEEKEGLEFVVCWSVRRIALAFALVLLMSVAATLLWIFLGHVSVPGPHAHGGFRDAGDRVTSGVVLGICILLLGLSGVGGWLGVSWLVM